jgi:transposase-like protein
MNTINQNIIDTIYAPKEGSSYVEQWLINLKSQGLNPLYITMDGEQTTMKTFKKVWPTIKIQRCLYHIQREGCRWLRTFPKSKAAKVLRKLLLSIYGIKSVKERNKFIAKYKKWLYVYKEFIQSLPMDIKVNQDIKRTITLIKNALPNMFHYLMNPNIRSTSNVIESFFSRLKNAYRQHRGLTQRHKIQFLMWYCYFKNQQKINN